MNRDNRDDLVSQGERLDFRIHAAEPDPEKLRAMKQVLTADLRPVRALPSDGKLIALFLLFFAVFSALAAYQSRYYGLHALTAVQMSLYFGVIAGAMTLCAVALVQEMIPGSRRRINPFLAIAVAIAGLVAIALILFPNFDSTRFVQRGVGCFRFGSMCGLVCGVLLALLLRRGFFTSQLKGAIAAGFLASLSGVAALAMHCSLLTASHILVWHFGVLLIGLVVGVGFGKTLQFRISKRIFRQP